MGKILDKLIKIFGQEKAVEEDKEIISFTEFKERFDHDLFFKEINKNLSIKEENEIMDKTIGKKALENLVRYGPGFSSEKSRQDYISGKNAPTELNEKLGLKLPKETEVNLKSRLIDRLKSFNKNKSEIYPNVSIYKAIIVAMKLGFDRNEVQELVSQICDRQSRLESDAWNFMFKNFGDDYSEGIHRSSIRSMSKDINCAEIANVLFIDDDFGDDYRYFHYFDLLTNKRTDEIYLTSYSQQPDYYTNYYVHHNFGKDLDEEKLANMVYQKIIEGDNQPPQKLELNKKFNWKIIDLKGLNLEIQTFDK